MKKLIFSAILLIASLTFAYTQQEEKVIIAVPEFIVGVDKMNPEYGQIFGQLLREQIGKYESIRLVDNVKFIEAMKQYNVLPPDLGDPNTAVKLNSMLHMNYLVFGKITEFFGDTMLFAQLIHIGKRQIVGEASVIFKKANKFDAFKELASQICITITSWPIDITDPLFSFSSPVRGAQVYQGPFEAKGTHRLAADAKVWLLLSDGKLFYLQNAYLNLQAGGNWHCNCLNIGHAISGIIAVKVNDEAHKIFQQKVRANDWGGFTSLPVGAIQLSSVNIQTMPSYKD